MESNVVLRSRPRVCRRSGWAIGAHLLALTALIVEAKMHLIRGAFFDPLRDPVSIAFFLVAAMMLLVNEFALHLRWRRCARLRAAALIGTGAAFPVAVGMAIVLAPLLPISVFFVLLFGLGVLAWAPLLTVVVYVVQAHALLRLWQEQDDTPPRAVVLAAALAALTTTGWMIARITGGI